MKARTIFEVFVASLGVLTLVACPKGSEGPFGIGGAGGGEWPGASSSSTSSGMGGGTSSSSSGGGGSTSSSSTSSSSSSSSGCNEDPCKLVAPQCGCAAGEMCTTDATGVRSCVPAGTVQPGQSCAVNDCAPGGFCFGGTTPICGKMCATDSQCVGPGGLCVVKLQSGGVEVPGLTICSENCDPSTNVGCPTGTVCNIYQEAMGQMRLFTACRPGGAATQGQTCNTTTLCAATYGCFDAGGPTSECLKYCKLAAPNCPAGTTCTDIMTTIGTTDYGACL